MATTITSLNDIKVRVEANGNVETLRMEEVRDAYGAGRLGVHVRANISKALQGMGLGHYPAVLPDSQYAHVRIYKLGSPVADLIDAVLNPGPDGDERIRELAGGNANDLLVQIRELVCA